MKKLFTVGVLAVSGAVASAQATRPSAIGVGDLLVGAWAFAVIMAITILIALVVSVISTAMSASAIKRYAARLYIYEKVRLIEAGKINPETQDLIEWKVDENGRVSRRNA